MENCNLKASKKVLNSKDNWRKESTVVVTGFGPYRNFVENSSWLTVKELLNHNITDYNVIVKELPVDYEVVSTLVPNLWETYKPNLMVLCGMSANSSCLTLEKIAYNKTYTEGDIKGAVPCENVCQSKGCDVLRTAIDVEKVIEEIESSGTCVKAVSSEDAGRYVCAFSFYTSLAVNRNSVFVHIPPINQPYSAAAMAETLSKIISLMLDQLDV